MLKHHFPNISKPQKVNMALHGVGMLSLLDSQDFDMQANIFKITKKNNAKDSLMELHDLNLMIKL
jgi:hypothetical protein